MYQNINRAILPLAFLKLSLAYHLQFFVPLNCESVSWDDAECGKGYAHGLTIAIDDVNNDPTILPGNKLTYSWTDSTGNDAVLRTMYSNGKNVSTKNRSIDVFIGPASKCQSPAKVAEALNIPMISFHCSEGGYFGKQEYPLFIQTYQNTNSQAALALLSLLKNQGWTRIGLIYEEKNDYWIQFKNGMLKRTDIHVAASHEVPLVRKFSQFGEHFLEFEEMKQRNQSLANVRKVLTNMAHKRRIKIFVLLTSFDVLIEIMAEAYNLGLTDLNKQHRVFIGFQLDAKTRRKNYWWYPEMFFSPYALPQLEIMFRAKKGAKSLLIISAAEPVNTERYERFRKELVNRTEHDEPFKNPYVYDQEVGQTEISEVASSLYDAVYQYALALHRLQERNTTITAKNVVEEFRRHPYESMSGYTSVFSEQDGLLKVHLSLLYLDENVTRENIHNVHVKTIGTFNYSENATIYLALYNRSTSWPWENERLKNQTHHASSFVNVYANSGLRFNSLFWLVCLCMAAYFYIGK